MLIGTWYLHKKLQPLYQTWGEKITFPTKYYRQTDRHYEL